MGSLAARIAVAAVAAGIIAALVVLVLSSGPPDGPQVVEWDRESCAHCAMHVGEPAFAVQLHLADGGVVNFDDPGCFFWYVERQQPEVHATYFHSSEEDAWLRAEEVAFLQVPASPMGFGLAAIADRTARQGLVTLGDARRIALSRGEAPTPERSR